MTFLQIKIDFNLEFNWLPETDPTSMYYNKKLDEIIPGEERTYTLQVQNIGNINDTYRISVVDYERSWDIRFLNNPTGDRYNMTVELDSGIFVGAENLTTVQLSVRLPLDAPGGEVTFITVEGTSLLSEQEQSKPHPLIGLIVRKDTMLIKIGDQPKLKLETDEPEKYLKPGETARYKVYIKNNGNIDYNVQLSFSEPSSGWKVSMPDSKTVLSSARELVEVFLTAPGEEYQVRAETREMITIEGLVDTTKGILTSSVGIVGVMDHVSHLNVSVTPEVNTTSPGGIVTYMLTIENLGNGDDEIKLSPLSLELGWNMTFSRGDEFFIEWKETLAVEFELRVPSDALAGTYVSVVNVSDSNPLEEDFVKVKTQVLQSYDMSIGAYNEAHDLYMLETEQYVTPGSSTTFDIRVTNDGNGLDVGDVWLWLYEYKKPAAGGGLTTVTKTKEESGEMLEDNEKGGGIVWYINSVQSSPGVFSTQPEIVSFEQEFKVDPIAERSYQPDNELMHYENVTLALLPGQSAWVQVIVEYPSDELIDPMYFAVDVTSLGSDSSGGFDVKPENNRADMTLEIKYSDLAFDTGIGKDGLEVIGKRTEENPQLNIRVKVRNIGEIDARDIEIALYVDDQFLDSRTVMRLVNSSGPVYKDILISFTWKPISGSHKLEVRIDPDNSIVESNEKNNIASDTISIDTSGTLSGFLSNKATCPIIFVILAAAVIAVATYFVLRKRKQQEL
jgi:uncharacterized membrane protein